MTHRFVAKLIFRAYATNDVAAAAILIGHTGVVKVPARCTSKIQPLDTCIKQPLDTCINKLFKSILRECWEDHVVKLVKDAGYEANNDPMYPAQFSH